MSFFKNIFGKKDNQNEEDSFADNELKREKNMNYKSKNDEPPIFSDKINEDIFEDINIDTENFGSKDSENIKSILNTVMENLEDGSEAKEKLKQKLQRENFNTSNINIVSSGNYTIKKVIKNGKVVQNTKEKTGDLDNDTMEKINDIVINVFKK